MVLVWKNVHRSKRVMRPHHVYHLIIREGNIHYLSPCQHHLVVTHWSDTDECVVVPNILVSNKIVLCDYAVIVADVSCRLCYHFWYVKKTRIPDLIPAKLVLDVGRIEVKIAAVDLHWSECHIGSIENCIVLGIVTQVIFIKDQVCRHYVWAPRVEFVLCVDEKLRWEYAFPLSVIVRFDFRVILVHSWIKQRIVPWISFSWCTEDGCWSYSGVGWVWVWSYIKWISKWLTTCLYLCNRGSKAFS